MNKNLWIKYGCDVAKSSIVNPPRLTLIRWGVPNGPLGFKNLVSLEPKVGLTSNLAVNLSFPLSRGVSKKLTNMDLGGTLEGLFWARVP